MHLCWDLAPMWASELKQNVLLLVPHVEHLCCSLQTVRFSPLPLV